MSELLNPYDQPIGPEVPGWSARARPQRSVLSGRYCHLEPIDVERHAADLFEAYMAAPDTRDWTYLFAERPQSPAQLRAYLERLAASEDPLHFTIVDAPTGNAVGTAALMRIEPVHGVIEVGSITFSPRMKKTRVGTESMYLLMRYAFDELGYRRYEWKCDSLNAPSRAAADRYGFTFEGIFRQAIVYKGRNRDTAWYSIVDREWPAIRAAFEAWLDPANFDEQSRQRQSLSAIRSAASEATGLRLAAVSADQVRTMMSWFSTQLECVTWGGPGFRYPFTEQSFLEDAKIAQLPSFALLDESGRMLGFGQYYAREGRCHLGRLAIDPGRRSGGLGRRLIGLLSELGSQKLGFEQCSLFVLTANERARRLYERLGFAIAPYPAGGQMLPNSLYMVAGAKGLG